jgi:hypothetical protein
MKPAPWKKGGFNMIHKQGRTFGKIPHNHIFIAVVRDEQRQRRQQKSGNKQTPGNKYQYGGKAQI